MHTIRNILGISLPNKALDHVCLMSAIHSPYFHRLIFDDALTFLVIVGLAAMLDPELELGHLAQTLEVIRPSVNTFLRILNRL